MLKIGEFSKLAKTTIKTLRYYDEIGLFKPEYVDDNGYRYYTVQQLGMLGSIISLRELDMPIESIRAFLPEQNTEVLEEHLRCLQFEALKKKKQITSIKQIIHNIQQGGTMKQYSVNIINVPEKIVYYRHGVIDSMQNLTDFVLQAGEEVRKNNPTLECDDYCYVTYTAKEYKEREVELEYVEAVKSFGKESENISFRKDPAVKALSVFHHGSYSALSQAYAFALGYVEKNNLIISGPIREVYIHGCWDRNSEEDYLTEIQIPIE